VRSREAILNAARELLTRDGPAAVTHIKVAEHAGTGRATVYRHWPRSEQLLADAMAAVPMPFFNTPTGPVRQWIYNELTALGRELNRRDVRAVATTLANSALWDAEMANRRERFATTLADRVAKALAAASDAGEVTLRTSARSAAALAIGPIYYRSTIESGTVDDDLIATIVEALGTWHDRSGGHA